MSEAMSTLPPNTTALERAIAGACAALAETPVPLRDLWNPERCPVELLPFLAWAFSVDRWDDSWPDSIKRGTIKAARYIHQHKGTIAAVRGVVEALGYRIDITEWWQTAPRGRRGTFAIEVGVLDAGITEAIFVELERLIDDARPLSRHLSKLRIQLEIQGTVRLGCFAQTGEAITVYPWIAPRIVIPGAAGLVGAAHLIETMTIYP